MLVQALAQFEPKQFFNLPSVSGTGPQRLVTQVSGVAVSNKFSGRLSVTTAEGDTITLAADLESGFREDFKSNFEADDARVDVEAKYAEYSLKKRLA